jgi:hypothetical protein
MVGILIISNISRRALNIPTKIEFQISTITVEAALNNKKQIRDTFQHLIETKKLVHPYKKDEHAPATN